LAPTGKLRVAFVSGPLYATKDPATGELKGVAVDLGKDLARRVGVPFDPVVYPNPPALIGDAKSGADLYLSRTLKDAMLVRIKSLPENYALLDTGKADVIAASKTALFTEAASRPGSRVLDGRILVEPIGMGVPKGSTIYLAVRAPHTGLNLCENSG
jgi:ABC-type amino acid transport substrate-binding protein